MTDFTPMGIAARKAATALAGADSHVKNRALLAIAERIEANRSAILAANAQDLEQARIKQLDSALLDRLTLNDARFASMVDGIRQIAALPDPVGEISHMRHTEKGLQIGRMRVPLGVIGIIYESRPNVTADAAALCLKSGNAVILRGGSEALHSNIAIHDAIREALADSVLPHKAVQLIGEADRAWVSAMLAADRYIDVIIPRGGKSLVARVADEARMPVIKHLDGICHLYVDEHADPDLAVRIADNGKTYRYGICGATETLLVHRDIAAAFLPRIAAIYRDKGVEMRGCAQTREHLPDIATATPEDWGTEYHAAIISIKTVADLNEACEHIEQYGSRHTDSIATQNLARAQEFLRRVDSASVMVNTPTCFADGYEYGLGAEIGISTDKIHWRGPVGVEGLTAEKFIVLSDGVTR